MEPQIWPLWAWKDFSKWAPTVKLFGNSEGLFQDKGSTFGTGVDL